MTRTNKANDRAHAAIADGTSVPQDHMPRYFAKSGHAGVAPDKVKKEGSGKGNWGAPGTEAQDYSFSFAVQRRRSNSSTLGRRLALADFASKFETRDDEPLFDEEVHGSEPAGLKHVNTDASTSSGETAGSEGASESGSPTGTGLMGMIGQGGRKMSSSSEGTGFESGSPGAGMKNKNVGGNIWEERGDWVGRE